MSLPLFITVLIMLIYISLFMKKKLTFTANFIQFMVLSIISTNYITIMTNNLEWMNTSVDVTQFISLLINRECILPLVGVIMVNGYLNYKKRSEKMLCYISLLFFISVLDVLHLYFQSLSYPDWSLFNTVIVNGVYLVFCIWMGKGLYYFQKKEEGRHGQGI
ncbi:hypothetical protein [Rossellomorea sp. LjRoot5]|uniref:hypothetical protein n=1 Tax=Rossellomorea sp. LjRoot5 TaxID=3342331 RepID=UPI003ECEB476